MLHISSQGLELLLKGEQFSIPFQHISNTAFNTNNTNYLQQESKPYDVPIHREQITLSLSNISRLKTLELYNFIKNTPENEITLELFPDCKSGETPVFQQHYKGYITMGQFSIAERSAHDCETYDFQIDFTGRKL